MTKAKHIKSMKKQAVKSPFPSKEATAMIKAEAKRGIDKLVPLTRVAYR